jgi:hydroxymethylglutaryl-CoA lyase
VNPTSRDTSQQHRQPSRLSDRSLFPSSLPARIRIVDVTLRDGLQVVEKPLPTEVKVDVLRALLDAGVREIEAVSFAHPRLLPQLADAERLMARAPRPEHVRYRGLVPNVRGAERARECGLHEFVAVVAADDEVSRRNQGRTTAQVVADLPRIGALAHQAGAGLTVVVACAFFAPARGPVPWKDTKAVIDAAVDSGATGVCLATTTGMEDPVQVAEGVHRLRTRHPGIGVGVHLHNRNGFAPANALAALAAGADWLESAVAGLGGDLWFPGDPSVLGNMATEDLVHLLDSVRVTTGVDLHRLRTAMRLVTETTGWAPASFVARGGTRHDLANAKWPPS